VEAPETKVSAQKPTKKSNIFIMLFLVIIVFAIAFFAYLKSESIDISNISMKELAVRIAAIRDKKPKADSIVDIPYDIKERPVFDCYDNIIIKSTADGVKGLDKKGEELWFRSYPMGEPVIKTSASGILVFDMGGNEVCVLNGKGIKWDIKTDKSIMNADISQSGHVVVVQEAEGYKAKIRIFDPMGIEIFSRNIAEKFVISSKVSPSGKQLLINSIDASGAAATTSIEFTDMLGNPFAARVPKQNCILPSIWYLEDDSVFAVGDSYIVYYDKNREEKWGKEFKRIYSSSVVSGNCLAVALSSDETAAGLGKNATDIQVLNKKGQQVSSYKIGDVVINLEAFNDIIVANTGREVYFLDTNGKLYSKYTSKSDIYYVRFLNNSDAAVITKGSVVIVKFG
jgi:hypothetical protein